MNTAMTLASPTTGSLTAQMLRWQEPMAFCLRHRHNLPGQVANRLLNIELGLFLLAELLPQAPIEALPDLLNGLGLAYRERPVWTPKQHRALNQARTLLSPYKDRLVWYDALRKYATLESDIRLFSVEPHGGYNPEISGFTMRERVSLFQKALV